MRGVFFRDHYTIAFKYRIGNIDKFLMWIAGRIVCCSALATFAILVSILIWQIFMPGSALRTYICEEGALKDRSASFYYVPTSDQYNVSRSI